MQVMPAFDKKLDQTKCVGCGQCAAVCTTGAITVKNQIGQAWQALHDPKNRVVVQIAPAVRVALGEEFGLPAGANVMDKLVKALKLMGVEEVYDTNFAADMTTISEAQEFLDRLKNGGPFPMFTSCCPAWVKYLELNDPIFVSTTLQHFLFGCAFLFAPYGVGDSTTTCIPSAESHHRRPGNPPYISIYMLLQHLWIKAVSGTHAT